MKFYLPIYVNNRRMHVVKLELEEDLRNKTLFSFLVKGDLYTNIFSLPSSKIKIISYNEEGYGNDDEKDEEKKYTLTNAHYSLSKVDMEDETTRTTYLSRYRHSEDIPVYNIDITMDDNKSDHTEVSEDLSTLFFFKGKLGNTSESDEGEFRLVVARELDCNEYILQFRYVYVDMHNVPRIFVGAIRICKYGGEENLFRASLDFGSEASQIYLSYPEQRDNNAIANMPIMDAFLDAVGYRRDKDYWQGRREDERTLYKSVYFINTNEDACREDGDLPMQHGENDYIQSVLALDEETERYKLLPNLKLAELTDVVNQGDAMFNIGEPRIRDRIIRNILCNFLAVTMCHVQDRQYLHFVLLVPNVYNETKVHKLVTWLYEDFNNLRMRNKMLERYLGIEVSVVSESDASFIGIRNALRGTNAARDIKDAKYLIIDAGKGTTDFSIIAQDGEGLGGFKSLYRSGIPASGHVLTYSIFEALHKFFMEIPNLGELFNRIIEEGESSELLRFVDIIEKYKILCNEDGIEEFERNKIDVIVGEQSRGWQNLSNLNEFLDKYLNQKQRHLFPGMKRTLEKEAEGIVGILRNQIRSYTDNKNIKFTRVYLAGRAFRSKALINAVKTMLLNNEMVEGNIEGNIIYQDNYSKTICTLGADRIAKGCEKINYNSFMLGIPSIRHNKGNREDNLDNSNSILNRISEWLKKQRNSDKEVSINMSKDFFYEGLYLNGVKNAIATLNGQPVNLPDNEGNSDTLSIYYAGEDGFIARHGNRAGRIEGNIRLDMGDVVDNLVRKSLFPYNIADIVENNNGPHNRNTDTEHPVNMGKENMEFNGPEIIPTKNNEVSLSTEDISTR